MIVLVAFAVVYFFCDAIQKIKNVVIHSKFFSHFAIFIFTFSNPQFLLIDLDELIILILYGNFLAQWGRFLRLLFGLLNRLWS